MKMMMIMMMIRLGDESDDGGHRGIGEMMMMMAVAGCGGNRYS